MPLIKSRSKKAFSKNVAKEMDAGKPQNQALAIAYDVKRRSPKKMADGGETLGDLWEATKKGVGMDYDHSIDKRPSGGGTNSGSQKPIPSNYDPSKDAYENQQKPVGAMAEGGKVKKMMPKKSSRMVESSVIKSKRIDSSGMPMDEDDKDQEMIKKNSGDKPLKDSDWTGRPTVRQAQEASPSSQKRPKIQGENDFDGNELISADKPDGYGKQPKSAYNEDEASKSGPKVPDMAREHSNGRKPYAKGGKINDFENMDDAENDNLEHPSRLEDEDDSMGPSKDEYMDNDRMAPMFAEGGMNSRPDKGWGAIIVKPGGGGSKPSAPMAEGGMLDDEMEDERHSSIAAAIMAKRNQMHDLVDSGALDEDDAVKGYADGGEVDLNLNSMEQPNSYYKRNEDAALKENYDNDFKDLSQPEDSNEHGDDIDSDKHDMISAIRRKMKSRKQF